MFARIIVFYLIALVLLTGCGAQAERTGALTAGPSAPPPPVAFTPTAISAATVPPPTAPATAPAATARPQPTATPAALAYSYPIGWPERVPGDGFFIRHGFDTENTWYNPGYWHTGEDWYAQNGDTAGATVYAIGAGEVVYAGANYPGRVVLIQHGDGIVSMYGHLDPALAVRVGQRVVRGDRLGQVLQRGDDVPNHLHFELRTFVTADAVNGDQPRYGFRCGPSCPPGPGYWPIGDAELPGGLGWRNPTHAIARRMLPPSAAGTVVVATQPFSPSAELWSAPPDVATRHSPGALALRPGACYRLLEAWSGPEDSRTTSALGYQLWYRLGLPGGGDGWVQAAIPSSFERGGDGRPSSVGFTFFPAECGNIALAFSKAV